MSFFVHRSCDREAVVVFTAGDIRWTMDDHMLPLTRQEKAVLTALMGVVFIGSVCRYAAKLLPPAVPPFDFAKRLTAPAKIDVNRATVEALTRIPLIGPARARAIVAFREERGRLENIAQIHDVEGIGPKIFDRIAPFLEVSGP